MAARLATVTNYLGLIAALRARIAELGINYATVDVIAGWTDGYASKLLSPEPTPGSKTKRAMGPMAFDAALGALAVKLQVVSDAEQLRHIKRNHYFVHRVQAAPMHPTGKHDYVVLRKTNEMMRHMSSLGNAARSQKLSPARRQAIARKAARARWRK
jgi:hypothetical protein